MENEQYHVYSDGFGRVLSTRNKWDAHSEAKFYSMIHGKSRIELTTGFVGNTTQAIIAEFENGKISLNK